MSGPPGTFGEQMSKQVEKVIVDGFTVVATNDSSRDGREATRYEIRRAAATARAEFHEANCKVGACDYGNTGECIHCGSHRPPPAR
jgi:hypothetical protein